MNIKDIKPGQTVYILCRDREPNIIDRTVKCVGRKYVTLVGNWQEQFYLRNESDDYLVEKIDMGYSRYLFATKELFSFAKNKVCQKSFWFKTK